MSKRKAGGASAGRGSAAKSAKAVAVGFVSLGCPKNLVDLQVIGAELHSAGFEIGAEVEEADVVLVNTCAFIEDAREEAVSSILGACELKKKGRCKIVAVTGCLPQRYRDKVLKACPDADIIAGIDELERIPALIREALANRAAANAASAAPAPAKIIAVPPVPPCKLFTSKSPGLILTGGPFAYLKIAEGCRHACAFCAIPGIRGKLRSRSIAEIVAEAKALLAEGVKELDIIAQDSTSYGADLRDGAATLPALLRELDALPGDFWLRILYGYPSLVTDELLGLMATSKHICRYLDIPVQHSHPDILRAMRRAGTIESVAGMPCRLREKVPGLTLRTTCLVGFPGETAEHFAHLLAYAKESKFDHLGAFAFSPEEGTPAYDMGDEPDDITAEKRRDMLMRAQSKISAKNLQEKLGAELRILLEVPPEDSANGHWEGRHEGQAPDDIDGVCFILNVPDAAQPGDFIAARVAGVDGYDLVCEAL